MKEQITKLAQKSSAAGLQFLLIGGHAVIAYGYERITRDIDLLIPAEEAERWRQLIELEGYRIIHHTAAFMQFESASGAPPLDVMFVNAATWDKLAATKVDQAMNGHSIWTPAPLNLIALKLHATKQNPARVLQDWQDIEQIIANCKINLRNEEAKAVFLRYATPEIYAHFAKKFSAA